MTKRAATPKAAQRLHHQHREIAAGARSARDRLGRGLRAFLVPGLITEIGFDGVGHRLHDSERPGLAFFADETARPRFHSSVRVRRLPFGEAGEVGNLVRRIGERKSLRAPVEAVDRRGGPSG